MADVQITPAGEDNRVGAQGVAITVWTTTLVGYVFYHNYDTNARNSLWYVKTTDGGQTWGGATQVNDEAAALNRATAFSIWYDQWTPGDTGALIHIAWTDANGANTIVKYKNLDTTDDTLSTQVNVATGLTSSATTDKVGLTKARGGNLYVLRRFNQAVTSQPLYRSVDAGDTWTSRTAPTEQNPAREPWLIPGNEADNQDIYGVWLTTGLTFGLMFYDDSANTWTATTMYTTDGSTDINSASASIRKSDNHGIAVFMDNPAAGGKSLHTFDISDGTTFTQKTDIFTGETGQTAGRSNVLIDDDDNIYVGYRWNDAGVATAVYNQSTDGGDTWGANNRLDDDGAVAPFTGLALTPGNSGGRLYGVWTVTAPQQHQEGNYGSSVALGGAAAAGFGGLAQAMLVTRGI